MSVFESLLNNTFALSRRARLPDGQGGWLIDYLDNGSAEGRIRPASTAEREIALQEGRDITHVLYVLPDTDIERGDLVMLDDLSVLVQSIREPSRAAHHLEVDCLERQNETALEDGS